MAKKAKTEQEINETPKVTIEPPAAPAKPAPSEKRAVVKDETPVVLKRKRNPKAVFKSFLPK